MSDLIPNPLSGFRTPSILDADWRSAPKGLLDLGGYGLGDVGDWPTYPSGGGKAPNKEGIFASFLKGKNADNSTYGGWGEAGLGILQGGTNIFMGMKNAKMFEKDFNFRKDMANKNFAVQQQLTNNVIADKNTARLASREGASNPYKPLNLIA